MSAFLSTTTTALSPSIRRCWVSAWSPISRSRLVTDQPFNDKQRWLELGIPGADTRVVLFRFGEKLQPGGKLNITLWADDVEATARELKVKGVEFIMEPKRMPYGTTSIFKDIDGNRLVLSSK